jgi:RNA polymerase sigma-70 factor, ECF subfamily
MTPLSDVFTNDGAIVIAMARGDEAAAAAFYDRHSSTVLALVFRMVGDRTDAESIVLEAFMQAWRTAARFDPERGSPASWLFTIARTRALDFLRTAKRQARLVPVSVDDVPGESLATPERSGHPAFDVEENERRRAIADALRALPDNQRIAIELAYYEGLSHSEIADRLSEPLGTVKTRVRLGMVKLRDVLRPYAEAVS